MVSKCANPECSTLFRSLRAGRLIRVESKPATAADVELGFSEYSSSRRAEFFWLCGDCSSKGLLLQKDGSITAPALCAAAASASL